MTISSWNKNKTNRQGCAPFAISADPSLHPSGTSCRRVADQLVVVAKKDTRHAAATLDDESATWRRTRGSYLTSRSFDCYACCRVPHRGFCQCVLLVLFKSRAYLRENDQLLLVRFHCARQDSPSATSKKEKLFPLRARKEGEGQDGSFAPSSVPNFQGKIAGWPVFDIDDGPIHRWGEKGGCPAPLFYGSHSKSVAPRGYAAVHGRGHIISTTAFAHHCHGWS